MSKLREQFDQERAAYQSVRYPGNLAQDLATRQRFRIRSFVKIASTFAAAACVAALIYGVRHGDQGSSKPGNKMVAIEPSNNVAPIATQTADVVPIAPSLPITPTPAAVPSDVPSAMSFPTDLASSPSTAMTGFPSTPSMPSWSDTQASTSDLKEPL